MTHDELLIQIDRIMNHEDWVLKKKYFKALRAVVELHKPDDYCCPVCGPTLDVCGVEYPCSTIQTIEKELI